MSEVPIELSPPTREWGGGGEIAQLIPELIEIKNQTAKKSLSNVHRFLIMQENQKQTLKKFFFELSKNQIDFTFFS